MKILSNKILIILMNYLEVRKIEPIEKEIVSFASEWDQVPTHQPSIIKGLLRRYHKLAICGDKLSCKTSLTMQLACTVASGSKWLEWDCIQGKVLYVNLSKEDSKTINHFRLVGQVLEIDANSASNVEILNLYETKFTIQSLVTDLIEKIKPNQYRLIILDSLDDVALSSNWDRYPVNTLLNQLVTTLGCGLVFTSSVENVGVGNKAIVASLKRLEIVGYSDVLIDATELELNSKVFEDELMEECSKVFIASMKQYNAEYYDKNINDTYLKYKATVDELREHLTLAILDERQEEVLHEFDQVRQRITNRNYWRLFMISDQLPRVPTFDYQFDYPIHSISNLESLQYHEPNKELSLNKLKELNSNAKNETFYHNSEKLIEGINSYFHKNGEYPDKESLAKELEKSIRTVERYASQCHEVAFIDGKYNLVY